MLNRWNLLIQLDFFQIILILKILNQSKAASYYCTRMGFTPAGYQGLETGSRKVAAHLIVQNKVTKF